MNNYSYSQTLYQRLLSCTDTVQHCSLLPASSYHLTIYYLYAQARMFGTNSEKWHAFIDRNLDWFQGLHEQLKNLSSMKAPIVGIDVSAGVIQLVVSIPNNICASIAALANRANPSLAYPDTYHITLAYFYKPLSEHQLELIRNELNEKLSPLIPHEIVFEPPRLHYFTDMTRFHLWDAKTCPFTVPVPLSTPGVLM